MKEKILSGAPMIWTFKFWATTKSPEGITPYSSTTVLLPGDSNGIVYHNDAALYTPMVLSVYDVIEMGNSKFLFIPFCGDHFRWENASDGDDKAHMQFGKENK